MIEVAPAKKARTYKLAPPAWSGDEPASPKQPVGQMGGRKSRTRRRKKSFRRRRKRRKRRKSRRRGGQKNVAQLINELERGNSIDSSMKRKEQVRHQRREPRIMGKARKMLGINNTARPISPWRSVDCGGIMEEWEKLPPVLRHLKRNLTKKVKKCKKIKKATKASKQKMFGIKKNGGRKTKKK